MTGAFVAIRTIYLKSLETNFIEETGKGLLSNDISYRLHTEQDFFPSLLVRERDCRENLGKGRDMFMD